jgi:hypothetical protein
MSVKAPVTTRRLELALLLLLPVLVLAGCTKEEPVQDDEAFAATELSVGASTEDAFASTDMTFASTDMSGSEDGAFASTDPSTIDNVPPPTVIGPHDTAAASSAGSDGTASTATTQSADAQPTDCAGVGGEDDDSSFVFGSTPAQCQACASSCRACDHYRVCGCAVADYDKYAGAGACVECMDTCLNPQ